MMKEIICTEKAPKAIGPYSQAVKAGGLIFVSGQLPVDETGEMAKGIEEQTRQSLQNIRNILNEKGLGMDSIVKTTVLLQDIGDFGKMNEVYATFFAKDYPARVCYEVKALPKNALVEIDAIAVSR